MELLTQLTRFETLLPDFLQREGERLAEIALEEIKTAMKNAQYAQSIIDGTTITKVEVTPDGFLEFEVSSERDSDEGFDIATAHEKGTRDHFIAPTDEEEGVLTWVQDGQRFFSKGHNVRGIKSHHIISDTLLRISSRLQSELNASTDRFFTDTLTVAGSP